MGRYYRNEPPVTSTNCEHRTWLKQRISIIRIIDRNEKHATLKLMTNWHKMTTNLLTQCRASFLFWCLGATGYQNCFLGRRSSPLSLPLKTASGYAAIWWNTYHLPYISVPLVLRQPVCKYCTLVVASRSHCYCCCCWWCWWWCWVVARRAPTPSVRCSARVTAVTRPGTVRSRRT